jgi:hypothetical protein
MKKIIQFTLALATISICYSLKTLAQNVPINFETGGNGATWTWTAFENNTNLTPQVVANPSMTGINTSANVVSMTTLTTGQPWAGFESSHGAGIGTFTLSSSNAIVKLMVYKSVISDVGVKFALPSGAALIELKVPNTVINQWEELTFDFSSRIGDINTINQDQIIFFPDFQSGRTTDNLCYIDNVTFNAVTVPLAPLLAAPAPTALATNVISMFSNTYTDIPMTTWATSWSAVTYSTLQLPNVTAGAAINDTKLYSNLNFVGAEPTTTIDATAMNTFNVDVWTPNITAFRIKLVDYGANGVWNGGGDDVEHELSFAPTLSGWNSYHIPLANFSGLVTKAHLAQLIFSGDPSGSGTAYIDNVYFSYEPPLIPMLAAPTPTIPSTDVISLFSNAYTDVPVDTWHTGWSSAILTDLLLPNVVAGPIINDTKRYSALDFVGIETVGPNIIDATSMNYFNIDVWTPNATAFRVKLVDWGANGVWNGGGDDVEHEISLTPTLSGWNTYSIPLSSFTGLTTRAHMAQYILSANPTALADVYIDNVFFSITSPLGLQLVSLDATISNTTAQIKWQTIDEENMKSYEIEKSIDGNIFENVGTVQAKNIAYAKYSFIDEVTTAIAYYRLKNIENNGAFTYSKTVSVSTKINNEIKVYPSPSSNYINIISKNTLGKIVITNAVGTVINILNVNSNFYKLDISNLPNGTYYVNLRNKATQSFIKQ